MKYNLLIAEDDPDITQLLALYLDNGDYHIFTADNGETALHIARERKN